MGSDWDEHPLDEIADIKSGKRLPKGDELVDYQTDHPYLRLVDISDGKVRNDDLKYLTPEVQDKISRYIVETDDVCLAIVGHTIGMVFRIESEFDGANLTENAARITNLRGIDPQFLYSWLSSPLGQSEIESRTVGSAQGKLPLYNIRSLRVPVPPLPEQKAIAHILGSLDDKIELNRRMNATLEGMARALFKSWFVDFDPVIDNALAVGNPIPDELAPRACLRASHRQAEVRKNALANGTTQQGSLDHPTLSDPKSLFPAAFQFTEELGWIPEGWKSTTLSELLEVKYGKDHKKLADGEFPVYGSGGLMRRAESALYKGESVLIPRKGTLSNILYLNEEFWTVDTMFYTIPRMGSVAKFCYYHLKGLDFASMNVGSAVPSMTTKVLNNLPITKASDHVLEQFDALISAYFRKSEQNDQVSQTLTKLRDTLLPKLISGDLRIPNNEKLRSA